MLIKFKLSTILIMSGTFYYRKAAFGSNLCLFVHLWLLFVVNATKNEYNKSACKGPISYYNDLKCTPIYEKPDDSCAIRYDCSHLSNRSIDKCYANGNVYNIGDKLADSDRLNPCDVGCICTKGEEDVAKFTCEALDCSAMKTKEGCYFRREPGTCCKGELICLENPENRTKCEVNGKTFLDGEPFYPEKNPEHACQCMEGYKGENIYPFCENLSCGTELFNSLQIHKGCSPVLRDDNSIEISTCNYSYRCPSISDTIIKCSTEISSTGTSNESVPKSQSDHMMCKFGNLTLQLGDVIIQPDYIMNKNIECVCEIPPLLTCKPMESSLV